MVEKNPYVNAWHTRSARRAGRHGQIKLGAYVIAGITDHITPWRACYGTARLFGPKTTFVLANAGHLQSMINPPGVAQGLLLQRPGRYGRPDGLGRGRPAEQAGRQLVAALARVDQGQVRRAEARAREARIAQVPAPGAGTWNLRDGALKPAHPAHARDT
jgi:hypothetical protein